MDERLEAMTGVVGLGRNLRCSKGFYLEFEMEECRFPFSAPTIGL